MRFSVSTTARSPGPTTSRTGSAPWGSSAPSSLSRSFLDAKSGGDREDHHLANVIEAGPDPASLRHLLGPESRRALFLPKTTSGSIHDEVRRGSTLQRCRPAAERDEEAVHPWQEQDVCGHGCSRFAANGLRQR